MMSERLYSVLLRLYPKAFRQAYAEAMLEAFRQLHRRMGARPVRFWTSLLSDFAWSLWRERVDSWKSGANRFALEWVLVCAVGAIVIGALASTVTWCFGYLYHPYLEGVTFVPWSYGVVLGVGLGSVQCAVLRQRLRLGTRWIVLSAVCAAVGLEMATLVAPGAGPVTFGAVLGAFVAGGQWLVLRTKVQRAGWWASAGAAALSTGVLSCDLAMNGALRGLNPLTNETLALHSSGGYRQSLNLLVRGMYGPTSWAELTVGFAVMATAGLVIGAITAKPLSSMLTRAH